MAGLFLVFAALTVWWLPESPTKPVSSTSLGSAPASSRSSSEAGPPSKKAERAGSRAEKKSLADRLPALRSSPLRLSREEIDAYLASRKRNVDSLLAAFRISGDEAFLKEALERFPNDPQVLAMALRSENDPAKRLEMIEVFKRADPENALANCIAARALFDTGKPAEALAELRALSGKHIDDFTLSASQNDEEAYLASGIPPLEARMNALYSQATPHVMQLRRLTDEMSKARADYLAAGDVEAADELLGIQFELTRMLQKGQTAIVNSLVGIHLEKRGLKGLDTDEARARLDEIQSQGKELSSSAVAVSALMKDPAVPDSDWMLYSDRLKAFGEAAANNWMLERHPPP